MFESEDGFWGIQDEAEREFLRTKYADAKARHALAEDWVAKRKHADKSKVVDGKPNPHFPRLNLEADIARVFYEMAHVVEMNNQLFKHIELLSSVSPRVDLLEGAYTHLRERLAYVTNSYKDSVDNHFKDRKEWRTHMSMRRAGLDPDKAEDQLLWARKMDELNERLFNQTRDIYDVQGSRNSGQASNILSSEDRPQDTEI